MAAEDNPADDVQPTKEEYEAGMAAMDAERIAELQKRVLDLTAALADAERRATEAEQRLAAGIGWRVCSRSEPCTDTVHVFGWGTARPCNCQMFGSTTAVEAAVRRAGDVLARIRAAMPGEATTNRELDEALHLNNEMKELLEAACGQRDRLAAAIELVINDFENLNGSECKPSLRPCGQCIRCILNEALKGIPSK